MRTIIFYGRREVGMAVLSHLVALGHKVKVIPEDDLILQMCKYYNLEIVDLDSMGEFDLFVCCHGAKIIPEQYLVKGKFINMHSCLWKYKGQNPIKRYIENKDTEASIESHYIVKEVDAGPVITRVLFNTPIIETYGQYFNLALPYYFQCIDETLKAVFRQDRAVYTSVKQDKYFPVWIKYYSQFFDHIYVINNDPNTPDPYIEEAKKQYNFTVINDENPEYKLDRWNSFIKEQQSELLKQYKWVLYSDADELVVPDPAKYANLEDYINRCTKEYVFCSGYNVIQVCQDLVETNKEIVLREAPLDITQPILRQRFFWWYEYGYNKPLLSRIPLAWKHGMHNVEDVDDVNLQHVNDKDLILFHLKQADLDIFQTRISGNYSNGKGPEWFYKGHEDKEIIPERFKDIF